MHKIKIFIGKLVTVFLILSPIVFIFGIMDLYRRDMIVPPPHTHNSIKEKIKIQQQGSPLEDILKEPKDKVIEGKNGYNFLINHGVLKRNLSSLYSYQNKVLLTKSDTDKILGNLEHIYAECQKRHIQLYLIFPPDNMRTCQQYLPDYILKVGRESPVKQLANKIPPKINLVPIEDKLINLSQISDEPLCYKTDSHWTEYAALTATQELINRIKLHFQDLKIPSSEDFTASKRSDIYLLVNTERDMPLFQKHGRTYLKDAKASQRGTYTHYEPKTVFIKSYKNHWYFYHNDMGNYNALFVMDSFGTFMLPFLANSFKNLYAYNFNFGGGIHFKEKQNFMSNHKIDILILAVSDLKLKDLMTIE